MLQVFHGNKCRHFLYILCLYFFNNYGYNVVLSFKSKTVISLLFAEELNNIISQELPVCFLQEVTGSLHHHSLDPGFTSHLFINPCRIDSRALQEGIKGIYGLDSL